MEIKDIADLRIPRKDVSVEQKEALSFNKRPRFGVTFLGTSHGFDIEGDLGHLSRVEKVMGLEFLKPLERHIYFGVFLVVDPETAIKRHMQKGETGTTEYYVLKPDYIERLYREYLKLEEKFKNDERILIIDGHEPVEVVHSRIMGRLFERKILGG